MYRVMSSSTVNVYDLKKIEIYQTLHIFMGFFSETLGTEGSTDQRPDEKSQTFTRYLKKIIFFS